MRANVLISKRLNLNCSNIKIYCFGKLNNNSNTQTSNDLKLSLLAQNSD